MGGFMKLLTKIFLLITVAVFFNSSGCFKSDRKQFPLSVSQYPSSQVVTEKTVPSDPDDSDDPTLRTTPTTGVDISDLIKQDVTTSFEEVMENYKYKYGKTNEPKEFGAPDVYVSTDLNCKSFVKSASSCGIGVSVQGQAGNIAPLFLVKYLQQNTCRDGSAVYVRGITTLASEVLDDDTLKKTIDFGTLSTIKAACGVKPSFLCNLLQETITDENLSIDVFKQVANGPIILNLKFKKPVIFACIDSFVAPSQHGKTRRNDTMTVATFKVRMVAGVWPE